MPVHVTSDAADGEDAVLADKDIVDDYTLRRRRLGGATVRGHLWRTRPERNPVTYLAIGAALALVALLIVGMVAFVRTQLAQRGSTPAPRPAAAAAAWQTPQENLSYTRV